jgi:hypothetical protein
MLFFSLQRYFIESITMSGVNGNCARTAYPRLAGSRLQGYPILNRVAALWWPHPAGYLVTPGGGTREVTEKRSRDYLSHGG